ncbi:MAG: glycine cleavage T C-terminal barrel domain-containing protein [Gemmatimonadales bacterium]
MNLHEGILAVRSSAAMSRLDHVHNIRIRGDNAFAAIDRLFTRDLYLRDGQMIHGLLLDEAAHVFADCYLASDDEEFFLLAEGPERHELLDYLRRHSAAFDDVEILDAGDGHRLIGLDGPYAWEVLARLVGQEVVGLPYLTFFFFEDLLCCRAGKTGEFGYVIIAPEEAAEGTWGRLADAGRELDVAEVTLDVLDHCALENWFFNVRAEGRRPVMPLELQLQWRVSRRKQYVGSDALRERRQARVARRLTCLLSDSPIEVEDVVRYGAEELGQVVNAGFSPVRDDWVALALLDTAYAYPGIDDFRVGTEGIRARSVSPPVVNNRSLYVNPQVHSYATRHETDFPSLKR